MSDSNSNRPHLSCLGCSTGNPFLCRSFPGSAPLHAKDFDEWQKQRAKDRAEERKKEQEELIEATVNKFTARA